MQIDFHHGTTYVLARLGGLPREQAAIVAHAAQYVDDATQSGMVRFINGAMFQRISSAHKMLDYRNFEELANHRVWIPFHFLPGNGGLPAGQDPAPSSGSFIDKLICLPDSPVAQDMVRACIARRGSLHAVHRLGITMHIYADTWAHQGFAGVSHEVNHVTDLIGPDRQPDHSIMERLEKFFVGQALPLGHGAALSYPDRPYLSWGYTNGRGQKVWRDNTREFMDAADHVCRAIQRFVAGDASAAVPGLASRDRDAIAALLGGIQDPDGTARHRQWLLAIQKGEFSFGSEQVEYVASGEGSWKHLALGSACDADPDKQIYPYTQTFLRSDWKLFHDALQAHRFELLHEVLSRYDICAA